MAYKKVLFVCLGNSCSSPMAESIMQNLMVKTNLYWEVDSAGLRFWNVGRRPNKRCLRILREHGLRSDHFCRMFDMEDFRYFDYIIAMGMTTFKELWTWAGNSKHIQSCQLLNLGWHGRNGTEVVIQELSPAHKLKAFRNAYYQYKDCIQNFIVNQNIRIIRYDIPSSESEPTSPDEHPVQYKFNFNQNSQRALTGQLVTVMGEDHNSEN